jgi:tryptophan 6-halogenase
MTRAPFRIVILGGGTAGWMAANLIAQRWRDRAVTVTVIESPEIGIIGVGEGSTPQLKAMFDTLGIGEAEWMPACNATYKNGISFHGWSARPGFECYFHPFQTNLDSHTANHFYFHSRARRTGRNVWAHPDRFFISARLAAERRAPIAPSNFPFEISYGYHFDATLVGFFLRDHAVSKFGVTHLLGTVREVMLDDRGDVDALLTDDNERIEGDFFIDASGFRSTILQGALAEPFEPFASNLFNDSAIAMPTPSDPGVTACETRATALDAGWVWKIPLMNRTGNGYVYSSAFMTADEAETELRTHLGMLASDTPARHLKMNVGQVRRSWVKNCLAIGLAQGFVEPLEATALHIVQATVEGFMEAFESGNFTDQEAAPFNTKIANRYEGIRDYIVAHYRMNGRTDTEYWRANAANQHLSESLKAIMTCWFTGGDLKAEIAEQDISKYYPALSWHCLLGGYGNYPEDAKMKPPEAGLAVADMAKVDAFVAGCAQNFPFHDDALFQLKGS